ncbi:transaldolase [Silvibacterium bohemicum]|uniref:Transaldolase n=1 Tax=Silvibacterium bohemicum TaxID=1577686 RepID=A0A841JU26_9BACT|nr:transaldolase [Silvibacterium bohemicum]MBB6144902.1 transaldolase [Silvibacterium bohemicum]
MIRFENLSVKLYCDGADLDNIQGLCCNPWIRGFTTNPTLMRKAGIVDYQAFAHRLLCLVHPRPVSFEVFADNPEEMEAQALAIAGWGSNVNVKIPVTNPAGKFMGPLIHRLSAAGVALNITAILTLGQVEEVVRALYPGTPAIVSVFAGRIADTGVDPVPIMKRAVTIVRHLPRVELLWASPREVLNIFQADEAGCDIITVPPDLLKKLDLIGKDLKEYSLETVAMFHRDASIAAYCIDTGESHIRPDVHPLMSAMPLQLSRPAGAKLPGRVGALKN